MSAHICMYYGYACDVSDCVHASSLGVHLFTVFRLLAEVFTYPMHYHVINNYYG